MTNSWEYLFWPQKIVNFKRAAHQTPIFVGSSECQAASLRSSSEIEVLRVPLCAVKNLCCASCFCTGGRGAAGSRSKANVQGPMKPNARPGEQSEAPRRRWKPGQEQHLGPEIQDSQRKLNQPRGSFPKRFRARLNQRAANGGSDPSW